MSTTSHRLGAIELIELGRSSSNAPVLRRPFLSGPHTVLLGPQLGLPFADIDVFLVDTFGFLFDTMADILNVAPSEQVGVRPPLRQALGDGVVFDRVSMMLVNIPSLGILISEVLLLAKAVLIWNLGVPGLTRENIESLFGELKAALDATAPEEMKEEDELRARSQILDRAEKTGSDELRQAVDQILRGETPKDVAGAPEPTAPEDLPAGADEIGRAEESSDLEKALVIGIPIIAISALVFLVAS